MALIEEIIHFIALEVQGTPVITYQGAEIDLTPPWKRLRLLDAIAKYTGIDVELYPDQQSLAAAMRAQGYDVDPKRCRGRLIDHLKGTMFCKGMPERR